MSLNSDHYSLIQHLTSNRRYKTLAKASSRRREGQLRTQNGLFTVPGWGLAILLLLNLGACAGNSDKLSPVTVADFEAFVEATGYVTDAERYGWSIVQLNVFDFQTVPNATWRLPDGGHPPTSKSLPVTQVSYNDAQAYCKWRGKRLPTYEEFWELVEGDERVVVTENRMPISPVSDVNVVGNVWDITELVGRDSVRLAGGSLYCSENTCHGTVKSRRLFVDKETGNSHIGFSVVD